MASVRLSFLPPTCAACHWWRRRLCSHRRRMRLRYTPRSLPMLMVMPSDHQIPIQRQVQPILALEVRLSCFFLLVHWHVLTVRLVAYNMTRLTAPALPNPLPNLNIPVQLYAGGFIRFTFQSYSPTYSAYSRRHGRAQHPSEGEFHGVQCRIVCCQLISYVSTKRIAKPARRR